MQDESGNNQGFTVRDKRRFTEGGDTRSEENTVTQRNLAEDNVDPEDGPAPEARSRTKASDKPLPPMDFSGFIIGLAETALFQLGFLKMAGQEEVGKDLQGAKHTIDLIALLEEKTRGNLTEQEKKIVSDTLFQLRMAFVEASK